MMSDEAVVSEPRPARSMPPWAGRLQQHWFAASLAVGTLWFAVALRRTLPQAIDHDARGYMWLGQALVHGREGSNVLPEYLDILFGMRLLGYPMFLSPFIWLGLEGSALRIAVSVVQLAVFWSAVWLLDRALRLVDPGAARRVSIGLLVLPFPYVLVVELLTESLVLSLAIVAAASAVRAAVATDLRAACWWSLATVAASGAAMLIRTDSLFVPAMALVGVAVGLARTSPFGLPGPAFVGRCWWSAVAAVSVAVGTVLFRVPHSILLRRFDGRRSFDTPNDVATPEFRFGVVVVKWATGIGDISGGFAYRNPFLTNEMIAAYGDDPMRWYSQEPLRGVGLVLLKWFTLVDQDVPWAFNESIPDRPSIGWFVVNHLMVGIGVVGLVVLAARLVRLRRDPSAGAVVGMLLAGSAIWLATHILPHTESRYGLPALAGLAACAGWVCSAERIRRYWKAAMLPLIGYLVVAWSLSNWLIGFRAPA